MVLRAAAAYSETPPHGQCRRDLGMGDPHCEGNQVENIDEAGDIVVPYETISTRLAAQIGNMPATLPCILHRPLELRRAPIPTKAGKTARERVLSEG